MCHNCQFVEAHPAHSNLGLDPCQFSVILYGLGGLSLQHRNLTTFDMAHKHEIRNSDIVYIDLGSNDAYNLLAPLQSEEKRKKHNETVKELADQLITFILKKVSLNIKLIVVGQILHRFKEPYKGYNKNLDKLNEFFKCKCSSPFRKS